MATLPAKSAPDDDSPRSWLPLPLSLASYVLCATLCMTPWAGDATALASVPSHTHLLPLGLHLATLAHAYIACSTYRSGVGVQHAAVLLYIASVSCCTHVLLSTGRVPARASYTGAVFVPLRFVTWMHSTPAMLVLVTHVAGKGRAEAWTAGCMQLAVLVLGFFAACTPHKKAGNTALALSTVIFIRLMSDIHLRFVAGAERADCDRTLRGRAVVLCHTSTLVLWCAYPALMMAGMLNWMGGYTMEVSWGILDAVTKGVFASCLLQATLMTADEAEVASMRAVTDAKARQLAALCHEIRNPLNGIVCNLCELDVVTQQHPQPPGGETEASAQALVSTTLTCAAQLRRTLDDFLDLSKAEECSLRLDPAPVQLHMLLTSVAGQVLRAAHDKGLCLHVRFVPPALGATVCVMDAGRVAQVLANFAWNSVKFTPKGSLTLCCRYDDVKSSSRGNGDTNDSTVPLLFEVSDTGLGLSADLQQRLFQPFQQAHTSRIDKFGSSGLGLNICKVLAGLMGGAVGATSAGLGHGSTFWLRLAVGRATTGEEAAPSNIIKVGSNRGCEKCGLTGAVSLGTLKRSSSWGFVAYSPSEPGRSLSRGSSFDMLSRVGSSNALATPARDNSGASPSSSKLDAALKDLQVTLESARVDVLGVQRSHMDMVESNGNSTHPTIAVAPASPTSPARTAGVSVESPSSPPASPPAFLLRSVLLVDDEPVNTMLLRRRLNREVPTCEVVFAEDGADMVRLCCDQRRVFDVVLMDRYMRSMNGDVAVSLLRAHEAAHGLPRSRVLCYSGNASDEDKALLQAAGFDGLMCKPINPVTLTQDIAAYCHLKDLAAGTLGSIVLF